MNMHDLAVIYEYAWCGSEFMVMQDVAVNVPTRFQQDL